MCVSWFGSLFACLFVCLLVRYFALLVCLLACLLCLALPLLCFALLAWLLCVVSFVDMCLRGRPWQRSCPSSFGRHPSTSCRRAAGRVQSIESGRFEHSALHVSLVLHPKRLASATINGFEDGYVGHGIKVPSPPKEWGLNRENRYKK